MRVVTLLFALSVFVFANNTLLELYKKKRYLYICHKRWRYINKYSNNEELLFLVASSCLKNGYIIPALDVSKFLKNTKKGRKNATYIATLFLMKKLIIQIIEDNLNISSIKLPLIKDHILGQIYNQIQNSNFKIKDNKLIVKIDKKIFEVSLNKEKNLLIEIFLNKKLIAKKSIW